MRIGIFTDAYPPLVNGVSSSVAMLEAALIKKGHQVYIVTANQDAGDDKNESDNIIRLSSFPLGIYDFRISGVYSMKAAKKIKKWKLDIIHTHTEFGVGTFGRIMANQLDIPIVHTYHTLYEDYVQYITKGYFDTPSKKIVEYLTHFYCDKTVTELIVPTKKTYDLFKEKYDYERNVHIVPTGIEVDRFYVENNSDKYSSKLRKELGITKKDFVLLFVGRLASEKNVEFLIKAQAELISKHKNCKLLIIGDGPSIGEYGELAKELSIEKNIIFTGKIPWENIHKYYQIPDVFVSASHTETQGLTLLEAMAASKPVVALDDEAFRLVVVPELNGFLFETEKEYLSSIELLFKDKEMISKLGRQARITADSHSSKYYAEKVLDVYAAAMEESQSQKIKNSFMARIKKVIREGFNGKENSSREHEDESRGNGD